MATGTMPEGALPGDERWQPCTMRTRRERVIQTLWFEALGLAIVTPLFAHFAGTPADESVALLGALSVTVMCWSMLYNTGADWIEYRVAGRVASDRPHGLRVLHALGHEATSVVVTWPFIVALTGFGWQDALLADIGLTLAYAVYGYAFHLGFDRLRPVKR
jgi:uncharacterized membrane protein